MNNDKVANWNDFKDIEQVDPASTSDIACLEEVRQVLERHGKTDRFGVQLLHKHFDLQDDEIMLEAVNHEDRSLHSRPVKRSTLQGVDHKATAWRLDRGEVIQIGACASGEYGGHYGYKDEVPTPEIAASGAAQSNK